MSLIRDIVEGNAEPASTEFTIFGSNFAWEAPIRFDQLHQHLNANKSSLANSAGQLKMIKTDRRGRILDFVKFRHLAKWAKTKILQHG